ncbi:alpha-amylase [Ruminobacter amylophilus]|uniref:Alpha-amylase n=1 Tax=Ruminobacter amylophilus TaxID=867 RepID=A0A662ZEU0_9GAMM|nr:PKD domain-containing protein [Ruminobacter amylophilus]SFP08187.1 alpha-amylase [Ruminobacter amylophilus]
MNFKNSNKLKMLALAISTMVTAMSASGANAESYEQEMVIVHPFQWTYNNIARECTEYLGPGGFDGVQISQPAEHINRNDVWWAIYQPVNFYNYTTMEGNESELRAMIKACNDAGVKVFADAVLNQRGGGSGTGIGGSYYTEYSYADGFDSSDFHTGCAITTYADAGQVRYCALNGLPDHATDRDSTQTKIAYYLANLMNMGINGFRIDAAKHMGYTDIESILAKTANITGKRPPAYLEVIGADGEAADIQPEKYTYINNAVVTDFDYVRQIASAFGDGNYGEALSLSTYLGSNAEVFVNNHDNEAGRCSAGTCSMGTQNNVNYHLAQSWMSVWPVGTVRQVYSGYSFTYHDQGGPLSAARCEGGWLCQHRVPYVLNAPRFARATRGEAVTSQGYDDGVLWFNRGARGFYAMNTSSSSVTRTFNVSMSDGTYCDILGTYDPKNTPCGSDVSVTSGTVTLTIPAKSAMAICSDEQWCGKVPDPCDSNPTGTECLCKNETTDVNGYCLSYCQANSSDEYCYCQLNPDASECLSGTQNTRINLCYAGTSNSWVLEKMKYDVRTGYWNLNVSLDGSANQRFKVAEHCSWGGTVYGSSGNQGQLAVNTSTTGDEYTSLTGNYALRIRDSDMTYVMDKLDNTAPVAAFTYEADKLSVSLTDASTDAENDALTYYWNFGNGTSSTEKNPSVTYDEAGTYVIALTVTDARGAASRTVSQSVTVSDRTVIDQTRGSLCYAGTSNSWTFDQMTYNESTGYWTVTVNLDGSASQRFKVVDGCSWSGSTIYGSSGVAGQLTVNTSTSGDEYTSLSGIYTLKVKDADMSYSFENVQ